METKRNKILEEVLPLRLIREVQKWPALYARDCPESTNSHFRAKVWHEVAKNLIDGWDDLPHSDKQLKAKECSKRWRHLYDTFRRRYKYQRKEYVYAKYMAFLNPHLRPHGQGEARGKPAPAPKRAAPPTRAHRQPERVPPRDAVEHIDEDEHFLLSLLPSFRRMTDDEKLTAKMEILRVIKEVRGGGGGGGSGAAEEDALRLPSSSSWGPYKVEMESEMSANSDNEDL